MMDNTKDRHLCGICKKIFSDLNFFLEHKSHCSSHNSIALTLTPRDVSLNNGLFCHEAVLDLPVLDTRPFLPVLHCENEEVVGVSDAAEQKSHKQIFQESLLEKTENNFLADQLSKIANKKGVTNISVEEQSKHPLSDGVNNRTVLDIQDKHKQDNNINKNVVDNENQDENFFNKTAPEDRPKHVCCICNFVTLYYKDLVRHMRKHSGERPYLCSICGKKFARQDKLTCHKRIHDGDKRYKCQLCEYATTDSGALRKHTQTHTDDRPHRCQMCSYRARNSSHMTIHLRTHTGDSPFFCQVTSCAKTFKTSSDLQRHLKVHKLGSDLPQLNDVKRKQKRLRKRVLMCSQAHTCSICSTSFVREDSLRCHMKLHSRLSSESKNN